MVSEAIFNYAENCVNQFLDQNSSVESIYKTKISHEYEVGSGVVIKIEDGPLNTGSEQVLKNHQLSLLFQTEHMLFLVWLIMGLCLMI